MIAESVRVGVEFHHVAVRIRDVDLRPGRQIARRLEALEAMTAKVLQRLVVAAHANGDVTVSRVDLPRPAQRPRRRVHDQVQLPVAELVPGAAEVERRTRKLPESENAAVELLRARQIRDADADVMEATSIAITMRLIRVQYT